MTELIPWSAQGLAGWRTSGDDRRRVLLLHGGPTLSDEYFRPLAEQMPRWSCASYQQRGRAPSTTQGPFDVPTFVADIGHALDHLATLGWERPLVAGHSWGGYLAWHVAVSLGDRVSGVLALDPLGAVGDMGGPGFEAAILSRVDGAARARYDELEQRWASPGLTAAESLEQMRVILPAYFADPARMELLLALDPSPPITSQFDALMASAQSLRPLMEAALPAVRVPLGSLHGAASPMPSTTSTDVTDRVPGAWTEMVPHCGHFIWLEAPGAVEAGLERLLSQAGGS